MLIRFLIERRSWIALFLAQQLLLLLFAAVDPSIPPSTMLYVVFLSTLVFLVFLALRYSRETRFFKRLEALDPDLDLSALPEARSPFERIAAGGVAQRVERLRETLDRGRTSVELQKDELLSWIHEVKTPLTAMRLMIDRLDDAGLKSRLEYEWLRIHLLLDQQLHAERLPYLENDLHIRRIGLESLVYSEIQPLRSWCIAKGVGFDVRLEAAEALSDAKWLAFIVRQLLTNAVKYTADGSEIAVRSRLEDGRVTFEVTDAGPGIDPRDLPRIFDRGFTSAARPAGGAATGMGLYLARKAADALRLRLSAADAPDGGSTFAIRFPKADEFTRMAGM